MSHYLSRPWQAQAPAGAGQTIGYDAITMTKSTGTQSIDDIAYLVQELWDKKLLVDLSDLKDLYEEYKSDPTSWQLREGVDFSEGGWATDKAVAIVAFLFFISSLWYKPADQHLRWMMGGTAVAHLFGGMAHKYYPNRAADGSGMVGFYVTMILGYAGNCARFGMGWGLEGALWPVCAGATALWLLATGILTIAKMERTEKRFVIRKKQGEGEQEDTFWPDQLFMIGEMLTLVGEVASCIVYVATVDNTKYSILAVTANLIGWVAVYLPGFIRIVNETFVYDSSFMQRIFHFAMLVMVWCLDASTTDHLSPSP